MTSGTGETLTYNYDGLRRLSGIDSTVNISDRTYVYENLTAPQTTTRVKSLTYPTLKSGYSFLYTYDELGNIKTYELSCVQSKYSQPKITYTYDAQGQLKTATNGTTSYSYEYDGFGNLTKANGISYTYGNASWRDLLTAYGNELIIYEGQTLNGSTVSGTPVSGNPTSYYNGTRWNFTWAEGRNLVSANGGGHSVSYTYDHNGVRTTKTVDGVLHTYTYASGKLLREVYGTTVLDFFYDAIGNPTSYYNGTRWNFTWANGR
ncbi:MAG: hypothetical protein J6I64_08225, partial [Lachnospiraceae bacterium]|nr:hypothetical protein [Lachnospiraceae bacterium]